MVGECKVFNQTIRYEGAMLRSKAKYLVEGDKCTTFFF